MKLSKGWLQFTAVLWLLLGVIGIIINPNNSHMDPYITAGLLLSGLGAAVE